MFDQLSKLNIFTEKTNGRDYETYLAKYMSEQKDFSSIDKHLLLLVDEYGKLSSEISTTDVRMINFVGVRPPTMWNQAIPSNLDRASVNIMNTVMKYWRSLFTECMLNSVQNDNISGSTLLENQNEPIAIIGMSFRLPGANNTDEFWNLLINGSDAIRAVPDDRWTSKQCCIQTPEFKQVEAGFLNCPVDQFDGPFFQMSPMELSYTDPQHRLLLEMGWEALEDAAIDPTSLQGSRTGIFTGIWQNEYGELMAKNGYPSTEYRAYMGNSLGAAGGRLAHVLGVATISVSICMLG